MAQKNLVAASLQAKKGRLYAVIQQKCPDGKFKSVWRALGLPEDTPKTKVNKAFREVVANYETETAEEIERANRPQNEIPVFEYMSVWLEKAAKDLQINTYNSYHSMIYGKIRRYFERRDLTVGTFKPKDIEGFYDSLFDEGVVANTVIHYHAVLRKAFQQAFKDELIDANPFDRVDRPKKNKFQGENYSEEELLALLKLTKDDPIYPAIMLAGGLGLKVCFEPPSPTRSARAEMLLPMSKVRGLSGNYNKNARMQETTIRKAAMTQRHTIDFLSGAVKLCVG